MWTTKSFYYFLTTIAGNEDTTINIWKYFGLISTMLQED